MNGRPFSVGVILGAAVGGSIGYFYFTDGGRQRRDQVTAALDRVVMEIQEARSLWLRLHMIGEQYVQARRDAMEAVGTPMVGQRGGFA